MPTSNITSYADLLTWSTTNGATNDIEILNSFEVPVGTSPLILDSAIGTDINMTINGNGHVLTLNEGGGSTTYAGLFKLPDDDSSGTFTFNDIGFSFTSPNVTYVQGALVGLATQAGSLYSINVNNCYVDGDYVGVSKGGILSSKINSFTMTNCFLRGRFVSGHNSGGLICCNATNGIIKNCFSDFYNTLSTKTGGITGSTATNVKIINCYSNSTNSNSGGQSGGIIGPNSVDCVVENCYSMGVIKGSFSGGIAGYGSQNLILKNCYTTCTFDSGSTSMASMGWYLYNGSTVDNCYALNSTSVGPSANKGLIGTVSTATVTNSGYASVEGTWDESITYLTNSYTSSDTSETYTDIWSDSTTLVSPPTEDEPYMLTQFSVDPWNHTTNDSNEGFLESAGGGGDPHIATFTGKKYTFDYLGEFRLFDNHHPDANKRLIINGKSMLGGGDKWGNKQYIRKIFISLGDNKALINTGFRGERCYVKYSRGFSISNKELKVKNYSRVHCWNCDCSVIQYKHSQIRAHIKDTNHIMKKAVRNRLYFSTIIDSHEILFFVENVNENNLQPCGFSLLGVSPEFLKNATGCLINETYSKKCKLNDIKSLDEPTTTTYNPKPLTKYERLLSLKGMSASIA
jgi:hypothetical protein